MPPRLPFSTRCDQPTREVTICIVDEAGCNDRTLSEAEQLTARLTGLVKEAGSTVPR